MNKPIDRFLHAPVESKARFTTGEFLQMANAGAFDDMKIELVNGTLDRMNPPMSSHGWLQSSFLGALWELSKTNDFFVLGETGVDLGDDSVRAPDIVLVRHLPPSRRLLRPDDILLIVEVADTTIVRDSGPKRFAYAEANIPHYWVVDGERSVVHVYAEPVAGDYAAVNTVKFGAPLAVPGTDATIVID